MPVAGWMAKARRPRQQLQRAEESRAKMVPKVQREPVKPILLDAPVEPLDFGHDLAHQSRQLTLNRARILLALRDFQTLASGKCAAEVEALQHGFLSPPNSSLYVRLLIACAAATSRQSAFVERMILASLSAVSAARAVASAVGGAELICVLQLPVGDSGGENALRAYR